MKINLKLFLVPTIRHRFIFVCSKIAQTVQTIQPIRSNKNVLCIKGIFIYSIIDHQINNMACAGIYQKPMYTKKKACELLRHHGIIIDNIDQSIDMYDMAKKICY